MQRHAALPRATVSQTTLRIPAFSSGIPRPAKRGHLQVQNAISRQKKEAIVTDLKTSLDSSLLVFGLRFKGLKVETMQKFRKGLPESTKVFICKNSLMKVATDQTEGWSTLAQKGLKGENAWVFVTEEGAAATVKAFFKFEEDLFTEAKKTAAKGVEVKRPTEVSVAVMGNQYLTAAELKKCESLPTKKELLTTIALLVKTPARQLASTIKQVPTKLARAINLVAQKDEDKTKTVSQFVV